MRIRLDRFDNKLVRLTTKDGMVYEGVAVHNSASYNFHEYGINQQGLDIDHWLFYIRDIASVEEIEEKPQYIWDNRTEYLMKLDYEPFTMVEKGLKTIELRLYDEKRRKLKEGDVISFTQRDDETETIKVVVMKLHVFDSFKSLYENLDLLKCGYTAENVALASYRDMEKYYSLQDEKQYGVVGIEIKPLWDL